VTLRVRRAGVAGMDRKKINCAKPVAVLQPVAAISNTYRRSAVQHQKKYL
jgi:hypothetical protein